MIPQNIISKWIFPEISIILTTISILFVNLLSNKFKIITYLLSQIGLLITIFFIWQNFNLDRNQFVDLNDFLYKYGFILTPEINFLKLIIASLGFINFVYLKDYLHKIDRQINFKIYFEYFVLNLISILGAMLLVSSNNFFNLYFAIEISFLPICILMIIDQHKLNLETIINYIILNALFSGLFLYGSSLVYGATGSLTFKIIIEFINNQHISGLFNIGISLVLIGMLFKLHVFPFQLWIPKIYEILPEPAIMLIASLSKIALISMFGYLFKDILYVYINLYWKNILLIISISSIFIGNLGAIIQCNFKRILAYSGIANSGFILLGLLNNTTEGILTANFNVISYAFVIINILGCLIILNNKKIETVDDFIGLSKEHPWFSLMLLILFLSIIGIPPTIGFYGKFLVIKSLIKINLIWVAVIATLLSSINLVYYLKIIKNMYFIDKVNQEIACLSNVELNNRNFNYVEHNASEEIFMLLSVNKMRNLVSVMILTLNSLLVLCVGFFMLIKF